MKLQFLTLIAMAAGQQPCVDHNGQHVHVVCAHTLRGTMEGVQALDEGSTGCPRHLQPSSGSARPTPTASASSVPGPTRGVSVPGSSSGPVVEDRPRPEQGGFKAGGFSSFITKAKINIKVFVTPSPAPTPLRFIPRDALGQQPVLINPWTISQGTGRINGEEEEEEEEGGREGAAAAGTEGVLLL